VKQFARTALSSAPLWTALGIANALMGFAIALRVDGSRDVEWLWFWTRKWLEGSNPFFWPIPADYPPWALVALSPVGMAPDAAVPAMWACVGVALAITVAWLGPKAIAVESPPLRLSIGCFLAWAAVRYGLGNGQFALLATACGLAAVWLARCGSNWSGLFLGLALIKPHLGIAFLAWAITAGKWRSIWGAAATVGAATLVFSARLHESAVSVMAQYVRQVGVELRGPHARGAVEIRPLIEGLVADPRVAGVVNVTLIVAGLAAIVWTLSRQPIEARERLALPLLCLWTLASMFHNAYDLVLLWPVWLAMWDRQRRDPQRQPYVLAFVQAALVVGVPGMWWQARGAASGVALHFDRLLVAGLLIHLLATTGRAARDRSGRPSLWEPDGRDLVQAPARDSSEVMLQ